MADISLTFPIPRPWLWIPPQWSHHLSPYMLNLLYKSKPRKNKKYHWKEVHWEGLTFRNPLGTAGGLDKNGQNIEAWWNLGAGFLELGTVTPLPQAASPGLILDRDIKGQALWNAMGFPNKGAQNLKRQILKSKKRKVCPSPIFVNIGKNRWTSNKDASQDYCYLIEQFSDIADGLVINISSPNTKGLRDLLHKDHLSSFLNPLFETYLKQKKSPPLLLKISPDLSEEDLDPIIRATENSPLKGWILSNTTKRRRLHSKFPQDYGGVSGAPLKGLAEKLLVLFQKKLGSSRSQYLIISTGGILNEKDVLQRLEMGANLTQIYSCLIFSGPKTFRKIGKKIQS